MAVATKDKLATLEALKAVNDRTKPVNQGGTGATTAFDAAVNLSQHVDLLTDAGTWAKIYTALSKIISSITVGTIIGPVAGGLLTGGVYSGYLAGKVARTNVGEYVFEAHNFTGDRMYMWKISGLTSADATPTVGTVYQYVTTATAPTNIQTGSTSDFAVTLSWGAWVIASIGKIVTVTVLFTTDSSLPYNSVLADFGMSFKTAQYATVISEQLDNPIRLKLNDNGKIQADNCVIPGSRSYSVSFTGFLA